MTTGQRRQKGTFPLAVPGAGAGASGWGETEAGAPTGASVFSLSVCSRDASGRLLIYQPERIMPAKAGVQQDPVSGQRPLKAKGLNAETCCFWLPVFINRADDVLV